MTQWEAWHLLVKLARFGDIPERSHVLDKLMEADIIAICLRTMQHRAVRLRGVAAQLLATLIAESFLSERVSASSAAEILRSLYTLALQDPDSFSDQLNDPENLWQVCHVEHSSLDHPWNENDESRRIMSIRSFGNVQKAALDAAQMFLTMDPHPSQHRYLDILKRRPSVIDLLLDCTLIENLVGDQENTTSSLACENLAAFFRWPPYLVPGISTPIDKAYSAKDRKALTQSLQILTSQPDWTERIIEAWMKSEPEAEDNEKLQRAIYAVNSLYDEPMASTYEETCAARATEFNRRRVSLLRLITTLSYCADGAGVRNVDIYSLLPIAYRASFKINDPNRWDMDIYAWPIWAPLNKTYEKDLDPFYVAPEVLQGPIAFARLLVVLAQRNALDSIQLLQKAPADLSTTTSLAQIQQITHPDIIRRFFRVAFYRIQNSLKRGRASTRDPDRTGTPDAGLAYASTAELTAAVIAFDDNTGGKHALNVRIGARVMLARLLSFVIVVAMTRHRYRRAYYCSLAAASVAEGIPGDDIPDWDETLARIRRQVQESKFALENRESNDDH
ncbi:hypothetical protein CONPUDRAFT_170198 [Coniophora puteana RWD-64-598 SS2]|uniref:Uncharacterized protein n=1 Tax=Coniophora puteana (strain RWD-64-598) TaxID=741705 RepID=R7SEK3_CONPW|nr:uncharacterized protein CONPUDRAFT_170198 [Coniophora puteana RWD-64-598 SS2]EIW74167.1 hypothetical protein CONPUDRAFT_170198 [Coniophora puteana RWD-64-598 SS2]